MLPRVLYDFTDTVLLRSQPCVCHLNQHKPIRISGSTIVWTMKPPSTFLSLYSDWRICRLIDSCIHYLECLSWQVRQPPACQAFLLVRIHRLYPVIWASQSWKSATPKSPLPSALRAFHHSCWDCDFTDRRRWWHLVTVSDISFMQKPSVCRIFLQVMTIVAGSVELLLPPPKPVSPLRERFYDLLNSPQPSFVSPIPSDIWWCIEVSWQHPLKTNSPVASLVDFLRVQGHTDKS